MALPGDGRGGVPADLGDDGMIDTDAQLSLAGADERLPWLESDDDYEQPGVDTGRIVAFGAVGLLFIVLLLGAVYFFTRDPSDAAVVPMAARSKRPPSLTSRAPTIREAARSKARVTPVTKSPRASRSKGRSPRVLPFRAPALRRPTSPLPRRRPRPRLHPPAASASRSVRTRPVPRPRPAGASSRAGSRRSRAAATACSRGLPTAARSSACRPSPAARQKPTRCAARSGPRAETARSSVRDVQLRVVTVHTARGRRACPPYAFLRVFAL